MFARARHSQIHSDRSSGSSVLRRTSCRCCILVLVVGSRCGTSVGVGCKVLEVQQWFRTCAAASLHRSSEICCSECWIYTGTICHACVPISLCMMCVMTQAGANLANVCKSIPCCRYQNMHTPKKHTRLRLRHAESQTRTCVSDMLSLRHAEQKPLTCRCLPSLARASASQPDCLPWCTAASLSVAAFNCACTKHMIQSGDETALLQFGCAGSSHEPHVLHSLVQAVITLNSKAKENEAPGLVAGDSVVVFAGGSCAAG
jgi:hypothetical protein